MDNNIENNNVENNNVPNNNGTAKKGIQPLTLCIILIIVVAVTVIISYMVFGKNNSDDVTNTDNNINENTNNNVNVNTESEINTDGQVDEINFEVSVHTDDINVTKSNGELYVGSYHIDGYEGNIKSLAATNGCTNDDNFMFVSIVTDKGLYGTWISYDSLSFDKTYTVGLLDSSSNINKTYVGENFDSSSMEIELINESVSCWRTPMVEYNDGKKVALNAGVSAEGAIYNTTEKIQMIPFE